MGQIESKHFETLSSCYRILKMQLCTNHTISSDPVIRPVSVCSGECTTRMVTDDSSAIVQFHTASILIFLVGLCDIFNGPVILFSFSDGIK